MRDIVKLVSTAGTGTTYTTTKNKRLHPDKYAIMKFDRRARNEKTGKLGAHVIFKEEKIK